MLQQYRNDIYLQGAVGSNDGEECFTVDDMRQALSRCEAGPVNVFINSPGGFANDGVTIYNALIAHPSKIIVIVDGMAASAGSLIAMAGDEIIMRRGSEMMIHDALFGEFSSGASAQRLREAGDWLDKLSARYAEIYAFRSKRPVADVRRLMKAETWFDPEEAVAAGFADRVDYIEAKPLARFNYIAAFRHPPERVRKAAAKAILVAAVDKANARVSGKRPAVSAPSSNLACLVAASLKRKRL